MSAGNLSFSAQVDEWVRESQQRLTVVFRESVQDLISEIQTPVADGGNLPVDTGFLRASMRLSTEGFLGANLSHPGGKKYAYTSTAAILVIAGAEIGETLYISYTANYARHVHYGTSTREGRQWITMAAQRWPQIVQAAVGRLRSASGV